MRKESIRFTIDTIKRPNVLLLGNGMLRLGNQGKSWEQLLDDIKTRERVNAEYVPGAMKPEAFCGVDAEEIQRRIAKEIETLEDVHSLLCELLRVPFDAILTTNYTYEIESVLSEKAWNERTRRAAFVALDGNTKVHHNTFVCNAVTTGDGRTVPVFHIHGEKARKHSMVLSYYSYANALSRLTMYNKALGNNLYECQQEHRQFFCKCWLDYFLLGNVWAVGLSMDVSEFDLWWAVERKARERAKHGTFKVYFDKEETSDNPQKVLLDAMDMKYDFYPVENGNYVPMYEKVIKDIKAGWGRDS